ncbi:hypothetical protein L798_00520 [Zootermopsis nevadensis]|uniref:Uncharacterized protein n=1 Tax=Zootermopsis nevadensis TaxID=136037 RepID=A0A067QKU7_ZOONE|nr:hypothetical protein L798_00520 [Zootermopsis nevadensis]
MTAPPYSLLWCARNVRWATQLPQICNEHPALQRSALHDRNLNFSRPSR